MAKKIPVAVLVNSGRRWEGSASVRNRLVHIIVTGGKQNWMCKITSGTGRNATVTERELVVENRAEAIETALRIAGITNPSITN